MQNRSLYTSTGIHSDKLCICRALEVSGSTFIMHVIPMKLLFWVRELLTFILLPSCLDNAGRSVSTIQLIVYVRDLL